MSMIEQTLSDSRWIRVIADTVILKVMSRPKGSGLSQCEKYLGLGTRPRGAWSFLLNERQELSKLNLGLGTSQTWKRTQKTRKTSKYSSAPSLKTPYRMTCVMILITLLNTFYRGFR